MNKASDAGKSAVEKKGWWLANRFLLMRRISQFVILTAFIVGPTVGLWILKGNLSASILLDLIPFTDPFVYIQSLFSGHIGERQALVGVLIIVLFYLIVGGRVFCSWVCPINLLTDLAAWLRRKFNLRKEQPLSRYWRYWFLVMVMLVSLLTGTLAFELINPVSALPRAILFGIGISWSLFLLIFIFDLLAVEHGWCGHLCPVGAFYSLLNKFSFIKVEARHRDKCDNCMDCFNVCPEPQILKGPVHGKKNNLNTLVTDISCTNCGRCVDVCGQDVFVITQVLTAKGSLSKVGN